MPTVLRGYAKAKDGNLVLFGTMPVPHSKDKPWPFLFSLSYIAVQTFRRSSKLLAKKLGACEVGHYGSLQTCRNRDTFVLVRTRLHYVV